MEFIVENATTLASILVILIGIISLLIAKKWTELRAEAYKLVIQVEKIAATKEGSEKFSIALERLYAIVPMFFKIFITKEMLAKCLQKCYEELKDYLDDGEINQSI